MGEMKTDLTPAQRTLLVSLHAKALDSRSRRPVLGDRSAAAVADRLDCDYAALRLRRDDAVATVARAAQLDTWTREFLHRHPEATVLHLGCGVDRRVDRVAPPAGARWFDVDLPEVIALCRRLYPERPGHAWLPLSVTDPDLLAQIPADRPLVVVAEALTMFLREEEVRELVARVVAHCPSGELLFDAYTPLAVRTMRGHPTFQALGVAPVWGVDDARQFERWVPGVTFDREWYLVGSRHVLKMPPVSIVISALMFLVPTLRRYSRLVRLRFRAPR